MIGASVRTMVKVTTDKGQHQDMVNVATEPKKWLELPSGTMLNMEVATDGDQPIRSQKNNGWGRR